MDESDDEEKEEEEIYNFSSILMKKSQIHSTLFTLLGSPLTFGNAHELLNILPVEKLLWEEVANADSAHKMERVFLCKTLG